MKIIFLGTNGWYDTQTGNTTCILIDSKDFYLILDAGNGIYKIDQYIKENKPLYLFISHLHIDHIVGLHILDKFNFKTTLHIYCHKDSKKYLKIFTNHPFTKPLEELIFKTEIHELEEGTHNNPFSFICKKIQHIDTCLGYRFNIENKVITYCSDTSTCDNSLTLADNADLLIHECTYKENHGPSVWGHIKPSEAAILAKKTNVKQLALMHFSASLYLTLEERETATQKAKQIFKNIIIGKDGLIIDL